MKPDLPRVVSFWNPRPQQIFQGMHVVVSYVHGNTRYRNASQPVTTLAGRMQMFEKNGGANGPSKIGLNVQFNHPELGIIIQPPCDFYATLVTKSTVNDQMLANQPQLRSYPGSNLTPPSCKKKVLECLGCSSHPKYWANDWIVTPSNWQLRLWPFAIRLWAKIKNKHSKDMQRSRWANQGNTQLQLGESWPLHDIFYGPLQRSSGFSQRFLSVLDVVKQHQQTDIEHIPIRPQNHKYGIFHISIKILSRTPLIRHSPLLWNRPKIMMSAV